MPPPPRDPPPPIGEHDRDTTVRRLQDAYTRGHISHEEMDERLHRALTAQSHGELATALASLPDDPTDTTSTIAAAAGRIRRRGTWRVPRTLKVESALAKVHLNLSRAVIDHPVVDIEMRLGTGSAKITVPRDAIIDIEDLHTGWKDPLHRAPRHPRPGGPTIRISGTMGLGRLKIRHARR